jgi:uncharacterized membrane protein
MAGPPSAASGPLGRWRGAAAGTHLAVSLAGGALTGAATASVLGVGHRGVEFTGGDDPTYREFAYLAFTIGMTFQVSDTSLQTTDIRMTCCGTR